MQDSQWPLAIPHQEAEFYFSVVCGNAYMHWALHDDTGRGRQSPLEKDRPQQDDKETLCEPAHYWKTEYLKEKDWKCDSITMLALFIPDIVKTRLFGPGFDTKDQHPSTLLNLARHYAAQRKACIIHVYVLSSAADARLQSVEFLFQKLPARIWRMKHSDFVSSDSPMLQDTYESMGVDRLATMRAALDCYGAPSLVIDGGTALTYTALDDQGAMLGGGILAGVNMRLASLKTMTGQLPYVSPAKVLEAVEERLVHKHSRLHMEHFAKKSTHDSIVAGFLYEVADTLVGVVHRWKVEMERRQESLSHSAEIGHDRLPNSDDADPSLATSSPRSTQARSLHQAILKQNTDCVVVVAGGDASLICHLLHPGHSGVISPVRGADILDTIRIVNEHNHLPHKAIVGLLRRKRSELTNGQELHTMLAGQRIARSFSASSDSDGDTVQRATIVGVQDVGQTIDDDWYLGLYDDGRTEELQIKEVYNGLVAYHQHGECKQYLCDILDGRQWDAKKHQAKECAEIVKQEISRVKALHEQLASKKKQAAELAAAATSDVDAVPIASNAPANHVSQISGQKRSLQGVASKSAGGVMRDAASAVLPSPAKKRQTQEFEASMSNELPSSHAECESFVKTRICKYFGKPRTLYFGTVVSFSPADAEDDEPLWHVVYDDNDEEDYTWPELRKRRKMYAKRRQMDPTPHRTGRKL